MKNKRRKPNNPRVIKPQTQFQATWSQLKLIKGATKKGRKPIWFEHLESIVLQDSTTRKIKDDFYTSTDLRGLTIPNLQHLVADKRIKDW
ncbi:39980_t:CDS:2, partial [Gigaspora margarita]